MSQVFQADVAVVLLVLAAITILISRDWRWALGGLAVQYLGVVILVGLQWPIGLAVTKLVAGWMAGTVLGITLLGQKPADRRVFPLDEERSWPSGRVFRLIAGAMVMMIVISVSPQIATWLPGISLPQALGGVTLIGFGLLQLGMTAAPFRVVLGLLMLLSGFEILYAAMEISVLVAGLLAGVTLGLALVGSYLIGLASGGETA